MKLVFFFNWYSSALLFSVHWAEGYYSYPLKAALSQGQNVIFQRTSLSSGRIWVASCPQCALTSDHRWWLTQQNRGLAQRFTQHCCSLIHSFLRDSFVPQAQCSSCYVSGTGDRCVPIIWEVTVSLETSIWRIRLCPPARTENPSHNHHSVNGAHASLSPPSGLTGPQSPFTTKRGHQRVTLRL